MINQEPNYDTASQQNNKTNKPQPQQKLTFFWAREISAPILFFLRYRLSEVFRPTNNNSNRQQYKFDYIVNIVS
jgi:hypothetical protein